MFFFNVKHSNTPPLRIITCRVIKGDEDNNCWAIRGSKYESGILPQFLFSLFFWAPNLHLFAFAHKHFFLYPEQSIDPEENVRNPLKYICKWSAWREAESEEWIKPRLSVYLFICIYANQYLSFCSLLSSSPPNFFEQ